MPYGTIDGLTAYAVENGYEVFPDTSHLARASRALDAFYGSEFIGTPVNYDASWPREGIEGLDPFTIPLRVVQAEYELAIMEAANPGTLMLMLDAAKTGPVIKKKAGEVEIAYADPTKAYGYSIAKFGRPLFIDGMLAPFLKQHDFEPVAYVI